MTTLLDLDVLDAFLSEDHEDDEDFDIVVESEGFFNNLAKIDVIGMEKIWQDA